MDQELKEAKRETAYYKKIAKQTGDLYLREAEELSKLISYLREVKETLRQNEEKLRNIIEHANEIFYLHDTGHQLIYVSPQSMDILGYTPDEMMIKWTDLITDNPLNQAGFNVTVKAIETGEKQKPYVLEARKKDGTLILIEIDESPVKDEKGNVVAVAGALRDITEKERVESVLREAQKMESIGALAGGIAHNFNNLLMGIQARASLIMMDIDSSHPFADQLQGIEKEITSASSLTKQLMAFARKGKYNVKPTDLNDVIKDSSHMFGSTRKEVKIHLDLQRDLWIVEIDRNQMEQVFLNLLINAWQAMKNGWEIYLKSENVKLDDYFVKASPVSSGNYVKVSFTDNGVGMDDETKKKIFDPFFTTRDTGQGNGLGLASVYGIIRNHGGIINVNSVVGEGSTFDIYLPVSEKKVSKIEKTAGELLKGTETVLLVDDEPVIINVCNALLARLGYKVITASSGKAAIELYKAENRKIDVVILDMIMPGMSGAETYKQLKEIAPDLKVILSSGYGMDEQVTEILKLGCDGFIQKPFKIEEFSKELRSILDKK